ncbi:hypothetical protein PCANB_000145 [Pneumocystis canis]|nr:hypothetical protein PCK1_000237 [Pneumocystis canis]KAG5439863.1 hypothetical protein PCANB_000145 [Pneumocystis canis]
MQTYLMFRVWFWLGLVVLHYSCSTIMSMNSSKKDIISYESNVLNNINKISELSAEDSAITSKESISEELTPNTFYSFTNRGIWLIKFYSPSCIHCLNLAPYWDAASKVVSKYSKDYNFFFGDVNCLTYRSFCKELGVKYLPTIICYENNNLHEELKLKSISPETVIQILTYVDNKLNNVLSSSLLADEPLFLISGSLPPPNIHGKLIQITTKNFASLVLHGKHGWLARFYIATCPYCKSMLRDWIRLAMYLRKRLNVADINCEEQRELCAKMGISTVPLIVYFKGPYIYYYRGSRKFNDLKRLASKILLSNEVIVDNDELYNKYYNMFSSFFVYLCPSGTYCDTDFLQWMSVILIGKTPLLKITNPSMISKFSLIKNYPSLIVVRDGKVHHYNSEHSGGLKDRNEIMHWVNEFWLSVFPQLSINNIDEIMKNHVVITVIFYRYGESKKKIGLVEEIMLEWKKMLSVHIKENSQQNLFSNSIKIVWVNGTSWKNWLYKKYKVTNTDNRTKVIICRKGKKHYWSRNADGSYIGLNKQDILPFLRIALKDIEKDKQKTKKPSTKTKGIRSMKKYNIIIIVCISVEKEI